MWHWNNVPMQHTVHGLQPMVLVNSQMAYEGALPHLRPPLLWLCSLRACQSANLDSTMTLKSL